PRPCVFRRAGPGTLQGTFAAAPVGGRRVRAMSEFHQHLSGTHEARQLLALPQLGSPVAPPCRSAAPATPPYRTELAPPAVRKTNLAGGEGAMAEQESRGGAKVQVAGAKPQDVGTGTARV